jgi:N-acetylglutamate synthase-like GNAT family acetyltransferase
MSLKWIHENPARWDANKSRVVAAAGVFDFGNYGEGDILPGDWWRAEKSGAVVGYGWMDATWGDAEVLLAVAPTERKSGVGTFIMDRLEDEARVRGLNHLYNVIPPGHPEPEQLRAWLEKRRFRPSEDGSVLKRVAGAH